MRSAIDYVNREEGHVGPAIGGFLGAIGALLLVWGIAGDTTWLSCVGGTLVAVAFLAGQVYGHMEIDYKVFARLDRLEKK